MLIESLSEAGGWKTPVMVARYLERLTARRGPGHQLAVLQRRWNAARST